MDQLPDGEEVIGILRDERAPLHTWVALAVSYYPRVGFCSTPNTLGVHFIQYIFFSMKVYAIQQRVDKIVTASTSVQPEAKRKDTIDEQL